MLETSHLKRRPRPKVRAVRKRLVSFLGIVFLLGGLACPADDDWFGIAHVEPIGERLLVIAQQKYTGQDSISGSRDRHHTSRRLMLISPDGTVFERVTERATGDVTGDRWGVHGFSDGVIWLKDGAGDRRLYARSVSDLSIVPGIKEAIEQHSMLSRSDQVLGAYGRGLVLLGGDHNVYVLDARGNVEPKPDVRCKPNYACKWTEENGEEVSVTRYTFARRIPPLDGRQIRLDEGLRLIRPEILDVVFSDPTSILVSSLDFEGIGNSRLISRIAGASGQGRHWDANEVLWTVSTPGLVELPDKSTEPNVDVVWTRLEGDRLRAILEVRWTGRNVKHTHQIVELDAKTGARLASHALADRKD
jgi:hypothetical protein